MITATDIRVKRQSAMMRRWRIKRKNAERLYGKGSIPNPRRIFGGRLNMVRTIKDIFGKC